MPTSLEVAIRRLRKQAKINGVPVKVIMGAVQDSGTSKLLENLRTYGKENFEQNFQNGENEIETILFNKILDKLEIKKEEFRVSHETHKYLYKMPELVSEVCSVYSSLYKDYQIIFFLDEIIAYDNPYSLNWSKIVLPLSVNLLLAISPVGLGRGSLKPSQELTFSEDFEVLNLHTRYRNTQSIQRLTRFIGEKIGKYHVGRESEGTDLVGDKPVWIDIGTDIAKIGPAIVQLKRHTKHDIASHTLLLCDKFNFLPEGVEEALRSVAEAEGLEIMEEKEFHGCECDTVFYFGSGHLEAFTRARQKLFIVTFSKGGVNNTWYNNYKAALTKAETENLVKKESIP